MLYIVATPIGNLQDMSFRALEVLKKVDYILCEDTRVSRKLLEYYKIVNKKLISYHQHSRDAKVKYIVDLVKKNDVALVTDAGTPGISDPGNKIVAELSAVAPEVKIVTIPGPSAVIAALAISGLPTDKFLFLGFPPHKKGRNKFFKQVITSDLTVVFYESCHRIIKTLKQLSELDKDAISYAVVTRELTKKFETVYRGDFAELIEMVGKDPVKGEYTVVVGKKKNPD